MSIFNRGIEIKKVKCPACGKMFEASERQIFVPRAGQRGLMCKSCTEKMIKLNEYLDRLPKEKNPAKKQKLSARIKRLEKELRV